MIMGRRIVLAAAFALVFLLVYAWSLHRICGPDFDIFDGLWC